MFCKMQSGNRFTMLVIYCVVSTYAESVQDIAKNANEEYFYGKPVFLTQYIDSGDIEQAREVSRTGSLNNNLEILSYSGFFTVNKKYNSNIFFWFFPALNEDKNAPIVLWLQGGPGASGLFGLFVEHGPFVIHPNMSTTRRDHSWADPFQMIYVDNPVQSGFSFTDDVDGYVTTQEEMADDMYEFLLQFFQVFHEYKENEFYIAGESYAGKYAPSLAYKIHQMGPSSGINLQGMAIGSGWCDPETMMDLGTYLYNIGLVDENQADEMINLSAEIVSDIQNQKYYDALVGANKLIVNYDFLPYVSLFKNFTGLDFYYNYLIDEPPRSYSYYRTYVALPEVRKSLNVGNLTYHGFQEAQKALLLDFMQSAKPKIATIMDNYRVMFYNGQLDVRITYPQTLNFLRSVEWKRAKEYKEAARNQWTLERDGKVEIAGYYRQVGEFYEVLVRNAGHVVPFDQPLAAFDLISRFLQRKSFS